MVLIQFRLVPILIRLEFRLQCDNVDDLMKIYVMCCQAAFTDVAENCAAKIVSTHWVECQTNYLEVSCQI